VGALAQDGDAPRSELRGGGLLLWRCSHADSGSGGGLRVAASSAGRQAARSCSLAIDRARNVCINL
jgi:hypothetical protein